ncbi:hypothetical protein ACWD4T_00800 [Streptomyces umbrinus]
MMQPVAAVGRAVKRYYSHPWELRKQIIRFFIGVAAAILALPLGVYATTGVEYVSDEEVQAYIAFACAPALTVMLGEYAFRTVHAVRRLAEWSRPLVPLVGTMLLALPAAMFPSKTGRRWLRETFEAFSYRRDVEMSFVTVLASYLASWPVDLFDEWQRHFAGPDPDMTLVPDSSSGDRSNLPKDQRPGYWHRHATEILWAAVFGIVFAVVAAVGYEIAKEHVHRNGDRFVWETPENAVPDH